MTVEAQLLDIRLWLDATDGTIAIERQRRRLAGIRAAAVVRIGQESQRFDLLAQGRFEQPPASARAAIAVVASRNGVRTRWVLEAAEHDPWLRIQVIIEGGSEPLVIEEIHAFQVPLGLSPLATEVSQARWWVLGASGWDRPGTRPLGGATHPDDCATIAYDIAGAYAPSGAAITLAHLLPTRWMNRIDADPGGVAVRSTIGVPIPPGGILTSDPLLIDPVRPIVAALGSLTALHRGRRLSAESSSHWGWNTWDCHTDKVVEADVARAIDAIHAHPWMASKLRYIIVDDAWQDLTGDWRPGARFGSIENAARTIRAAGFTPGIWSAPFFVDRHSQLLAKHPDIALKLRDGQYYSHCMGCDPPWGDRIYMDPTHPAVPEHLFQLYRRLKRWGFGYFKTDFLHNAIGTAFPGDQAKHRDQVRFHDSALGLVRAHRTCMEAIRAALGPDAFWLGCGTHFASGAGLMDATRISGDIRPFYPNLAICARSAIFDFHVHGGSFLLDPDFAVFRGRETALPGGLELPPNGTKAYDRRTGDSGPTFDRQEARLWAAVLIMSGGMVTLSDRIDGLNEDGLAIVRTLLEHGGGEAAIPQDIFAPLPRIWRKNHRGTTYVLLANWDDAGPERVALPAELPAGAILDDVWGGPAVIMQHGLALPIAAHGHRLLRMRI